MIDTSFLCSRHSLGRCGPGHRVRGPSGVGRPPVSLLDSTKHKLTTLGELDTVPFWLSATSDATSFFDEPGWQQAQIMLVENF